MWAFPGGQVREHNLEGMPSWTPNRLIPWEPLSFLFQAISNRMEGNAQPLGPPASLLACQHVSLLPWETLGALTGKTRGPALDRRLSHAPPASLPTAEKQEKVIIFKFLRFAFNSFTPPLRSSLKTSSVYSGYWILIYHHSSPWGRLQSSEQTVRRMFALVSFIILSLVMTMEEKGVCS